MGGGLALAVVLILYANVMLIILSRRLDPILFREPWFSSAEMVMYSSWPLSLFKVSQYMLLFTFPNASKRKRFIGLKQSLPVGKSIRIASKVYSYMTILFLLIGVAYVLFIGTIYAIDNWLN